MLFTRSHPYIESLRSAFSAVSQESSWLFAVKLQREGLQA